MNDNEIITRRILLSTPFVSDAKSILGMLALNLSEPIQIVFESTDLIDTIKVDNAISKWEV